MSCTYGRWSRPAIALLASLVVGLSSSAPAIADEPTLDAPIALVGQTDGASLEGAQIRVDLWPRDDVEKRGKVGEHVPTREVPASHIAINGSTFTVRLRPEDVPKSIMNDDGRVHISVRVVDSNNSTIGFSEKTVKVFRSESTRQPAWIDASSVLAEDAEVDGVRVEPGQVRLNMRAAKTSLSRVSLPSTASCGNGWTRVQSTSSSRSPRDRWGVLGKTYIPKGTKSTAWAGHSVGRSNTFGSAYSAGKDLSYGRKGSHTYTSSVEFEWDRGRSPYMEYQVGVRYGKYQYQVEDQDGQCWRGEDRLWKARYNTGGYKPSYSTYQPTWRKECVTVKGGRWTRKFTDGNNYSWSVGLRFKSFIGIDLSAARAYTTSSYIAYWAAGEKKLCGNDHVPAKASLVRMAKTW